MLLKGAKILDGNYKFSHKDLSIVGDNIQEVYLPGEGDGLSDDVVDLTGYTILPGLIDIHTHGSHGIDVMSGDLNELSRHMARNGVTCFMPTTLTQDVELLKKVVTGSTETDGAKIIGYHLEGPYLSKLRSGAQNPAFIRSAVEDDFEDCRDVRMITIAPESVGAYDFIKKYADDVVISLGHTDCSYDMAVRAFNCGAKCLTHMFNAMPPLFHRAPGPIGAALSEDAYVQVIADGRHVHPAMVLLAYRTFGSSRMILISDSIVATGMSDGEYEFGGLTINVGDGVARTKDGNLAGSTSTLWECVRSASYMGIPFEEAHKMASLTPARLMGLSRKGVIANDKDADLFVVDSEFNIVRTMVGGKFVS